MATLLLIGLAVLAGGGARAQSGTISVAAVVLSKSNCKFDNTTAALVFGNLDPAASGDATATASIGFKCGGSAPNASFAITHDSGQHEMAPNANRMKHDTLNEYLAYSLNLNPSSGTVPKNSQQTLSSRVLSPKRLTRTPISAATRTAWWSRSNPDTLDSRWKSNPQAVAAPHRSCAH